MLVSRPCSRPTAPDLQTYWKCCRAELQREKNQLQICLCKVLIKCARTEQSPIQRHRLRLRRRRLQPLFVHGVRLLATLYSRELLALDGVAFALAQPPLGAQLLLQPRVVVLQRLGAVDAGAAALRAGVRLRAVGQLLAAQTIRFRLLLARQPVLQLGVALDATLLLFGALGGQLPLFGLPLAAFLVLLGLAGGLGVEG